jgi:HK97 family phage prohead protease
MPNPNNYDNKDDFMGVCVPQVKQEGVENNPNPSQNEAVAICNSMWNQKDEGENMNNQKSASQYTETRFLNQERSNVRQEGEEGKIAGYGAVFWDGNAETEFKLFSEDNIDIVERIQPGAFDGVLEQDVRAFFNHDMNQILGRRISGTLRIGVDNTGLWYEIDAPDTATAREVLELIRRGDVSGSSFSFGIDDVDSAIEWTAEEGKEVRWLKRFDELIDVGPVAMPAYEGTVADVRSIEKVKQERQQRMQPQDDGTEQRNTCQQGDADLQYVEATIATRKAGLE